MGISRRTGNTGSFPWTYVQEVEPAADGGSAPPRPPKSAATVRADAAALGIADQRAASKDAWMALLKGTCSGTFVLRASAGMGADVVATITVVKPGGAGAGHFHHRIIRDGKHVKLIGSQHAHKSLAELVTFYQNAKYFAQAGKPDVPASDNSVTTSECAREP